MKQTTTKRISFVLCLALMLMVLSGCMAFDVALQVNEDGSGKLIYDVLWKPDVGTNSEESVPDGTKYIPSVTIDGVEYTGYRVTREFSNLNELESILLEKSGEDEMLALDSENTSGVQEAIAFRLGNFISSAEISMDTNLKTCSLDIIFSPLDLSSLAGTVDEAGNRVEVDNSDIFTLYFDIDLPGNISSAMSNLAKVEHNSDSAQFIFAPDSVEETQISVKSDYSNNTYIYSDRPVPQESYTYSGDVEANKALDKQTEEMYKQDPVNQSDSSKLIFPYVIGAGVFIIAFVAFCVIKLKFGSGKDDKAYDRKLKRDEQNEKSRNYNTMAKSNKNNKKK